MKTYKIYKNNLPKYTDNNKLVDIFYSSNVVVSIID